MRKFIVSDLHGCGEVYDSIMGFLDNIALTDSVELTINGDLIDRGFDSFRMLSDVKSRIQNPQSFSVRLLGGNHELLFYHALLKKRKGKPLGLSLDWRINGGEVTRNAINQEADVEETCSRYKNFIGNLKLYHTFTETVGDKPIIVAHAQAPKKVEIPCSRKIGDNSFSNYFMVWAREYDDYGCRHMIGHPDYFTIVGHTVVEKYPGFFYQKDQNYLNIDGGCGAYAYGYFPYNTVPLVEILDGYLRIFIFNHNNEIIDGYYFDGEKEPMSEEELNRFRGFLNPSCNVCEEEIKKAIRKALKQK